MRDGWEIVPLGDVAQVNPKEPPLTADAPFVPMDAVDAHGRWVRRFETRGSRGGARFRGGDTLVARITPCLENGKIAQVPQDIEKGGGSTELLVVRAGPRLCADFLFYWAQSDQTIRAATALMVGSTGRQRVAATDFRNLPIPVPPLAEQKRIVDVIAAVDAVKDALVRRASVLTSLLHAHLDTFDSPQTFKLGRIAQMRSGPSWKASDERSQPGDDARPVIGIRTTRPDGTLDLSEMAFVSGLSESVRTIGGRSLVMIRTNGNRARIGNVYRPGPALSGAAVSAFQILIDLDDDTDRDCAYWYLRAPKVQRLITEAASGTTGLGNVAIKWLKDLEVPYPAEAERDQFVGTAEALQSTIDATDRCTEATRRVRGALLKDLLSGRYEIPESYDHLLAEAV